MEGKLALRCPVQCVLAHIVPDYRRRVSVDLRQVVFFVDAAAVQEGIDLAPSRSR
jgi:hypothetical protein